MKARRLLIGLSVPLVVAAGAIIGTSVWTRHQLLAGPLRGVCATERDRTRIHASPQWTRLVLARAALARNHPGGYGASWPFRFSAVTYFGFVFLGSDTRAGLVDRLPACSPHSAQH